MLQVYTSGELTNDSLFEFKSNHIVPVALTWRSSTACRAVAERTVYDLSDWSLTIFGAFL
jgi:hypothetical protein